MKLIVLKNNVPLNEVVLDFVDSYGSYEIFIGRADDCHVIIDDPLISRHHLVIKNQNDKWYCEKLSELGVLLINGSLITQAEIVGGEEIKFGPYTLIPVELPKKIEEKVEETPDESEKAPEALTVEDIPDSDIPEPVEEIEEETEILTEGSSSEVEEEASDENNDSFGESDYSNQEDSYSDLDSGYDDQSMDLVASEDDSEEESTDFGGDEYSDGFGGGDLEGFSGSEDGFGDQDEGTRFLKAFINYQLVIFGEYAPYDRYQLDTDEVFIGRDPNKCQIVLNDPEVSSVHAVIRKNGNEITLEDMNSSNGTLLHGERINKAHILTGDEFLIGSTTFTLDIKSDLLEAESDRLMPVESGQVIETEEYEEEEVDLDEGEISFDGPAEPEEKSIIKRILKNPQQRKKAIYIGAGLILVWALLYEGEEAAPPTPQKAPEQKVVEEKPRIQLSPELENRRNVAYELGVSFFEQNKYFEALKEFETVVSIDPEYKNVQTYFEQTKLGLKQLEELEAKKRADEERIALKKVIDELLVKAREAVKNRQVQLAENYFAQIVEKDPENMEIQQLKLELEIWQKEEEKKRLEQAAKEAARKTMVDAMAPGKTFYLKKDWYKAILKLEEFLNRKGNDEDLIKEASDMLADAKSELAQELGPLLGRARSLKEGQDLKNAYEAYLNILKVEPTNAEALNEIDNIRNQIDTRSKRLYREAIISESLSLFNDAKEKLQEVQQISPTDSEYYRKASDKLKTYLE
ncbi:MAG TPA: FHA domain-containing protein [Bacteriovoracaceae bacterium]|nr:FHA domain-containing protein [Bacteriovoracaceae bacterium]